MQARTSDGADTTLVVGDIAPNDTVDEPNVAWVRLCATAHGSMDGETFTAIGRACAGSALRLQGFAASSHGGGRVRFLFVAPTRDGGALAQPSNTATVGTVRASTVLSGPLP